MAREKPSLAAAPLKPDPTFELRQFVWGTPDRLFLKGSFDGLPDAPADAAPVLVVKAGETVHRLPALPETVDGAPESGQIWQAGFAWQDPPVAFGAAEPQLGPDLVVELPQAGGGQRSERPRVLQVRSARADVTEPRLDGMQSVEIYAELDRARHDLEAERVRRAGDSERFREGLATVPGLAEQALSAEQTIVNRLGNELREAEASIESKDAAMEVLRTQLEAADAAQTETEARAQAEVETLRQQVAELESNGEEAERLRSEVESRGEEAQRLRSQLEEAQTAADKARSDVERLRSQLETARSTIDEARSDAERFLSRLTSLRHQQEG
jgi:hypothetical protein